MTETNPTREFYAVEDYLPPVDLGPMPELGEPGADPREQWRRIVIDGKVTDYEVSDYGRVVNPKGRLMALSRPGNHGTSWVFFTVDGRRVSMRVDKLVLRAYADPAADDTWVPSHVNRDLTDNRLGNLRWAPPKTPVPMKKATPVGGATKKSRKKPVATPRKVPRPRKPEQVEVTRTYRLHDMSVSVDLKGNAEVVLGHDYEPVELTATQLATLATLLGRVAEMNAVMGAS